MTGAPVYEQSLLSNSRALPTFFVRAK